jgi:murein DD-endopeptidase MepM/ murein hydrolase activator NlpD
VSQWGQAFRVADDPGPHDNEIEQVAEPVRPNPPPVVPPPVVPPPPHVHPRVVPSGVAIISMEWLLAKTLAAFGRFDRISAEWRAGGWAYQGAWYGERFGLVAAEVPGTGGAWGEPVWVVRPDGGQGKPVPAPTPPAGSWLTHWPVPGQFRVTQLFGENRELYLRLNPLLPGHEGVDVGAPAGSHVVAVAAGRVARAVIDERVPKARGGTGHNYGTHIKVDHGDGRVTTYAHLSALRTRVGEPVAAGQLIGLVGSTGNSTGPHLHFGLQLAGATASGRTQHGYDFVDPMPLLAALLEGKVNHV